MPGGVHRGSHSTVHKYPICHQKYRNLKRKRTRVLPDVKGTPSNSRVAMSVNLSFSFSDTDLPAFSVTRVCPEWMKRMDLPSTRVYVAVLSVGFRDGAVVARLKRGSTRGCLAAWGVCHFWVTSGVPGGVPGGVHGGSHSTMHKYPICHQNHRNLKRKRTCVLRCIFFVFFPDSFTAHFPRNSN